MTGTMTKTGVAAMFLATLGHICALPAAPRAEAAVRASQEPLRAHIYPRIARAPARLTIQALVEPADENRALRIVVDSATYYRSSTIPLSGAQAARFHAVEFRFVPVGTHDIVVSVLDTDGAVRAVVNDRVVIVE
jgi:hypothetical protein